MSDDHLWDGSGPQDPELERLERALRPLRYQGTLPEILPEQDAADAGPSGFMRLLLVAAVALICAGAGLMVGPLRRDRAHVPASAGAWECAPLAGQPRLGQSPLHSSGLLRVGEWLETDATSRARVAVADIGEVTLEPSSRLRLVGTGARQHRIELARGRLHALVTAPPRLFIVDTPAAQAVDLGCEYSLQVDEEGAGVLDVTLGFVSLERGAAVSVVPAGARCKIRPEVGPGTPYYADAHEDFLAALDSIDFAGAGYDVLCKVLSNARGADALSLWHLLQRTSGESRAAVYDRLAGLAEAPSSVTREGTLALDPDMLRAWRDYLGFGY